MAKIAQNWLFLNGVNFSASLNFYGFNTEFCGYIFNFFHPWVINSGGITIWFYFLLYLTKSAILWDSTDLQSGPVSFFDISTSKLVLVALF